MLEMFKFKITNNFITTIWKISVTFSQIHLWMVLLGMFLHWVTNKNKSNALIFLSAQMFKMILIYVLE